MTQLISQPQESQQSPEKLRQPERKPKHRLFILIGWLAAGAGLAGLGYFLSRPKTEPFLEVKQTFSYVILDCTPEPSFR